MYKIVLMSGAEYAVDWCGKTDDLLIIRLTDEYDKTFADAAAEFSDASNTGEIRFIYGAMTDTYIGYTQPILLQDQRPQGGGYMIHLRRNNA